MTVKLGMLARSKVSLRPDARRTSENTAEGGGDRAKRRWLARRPAERKTASYWRKKGSMCWPATGEGGRAWNSEVAMWGWAVTKAEISADSAEDREGRMRMRVSLELGELEEREEERREARRRNGVKWPIPALGQMTMWVWVWV